MKTKFGSKKRDIEIDRFRGALVILMVAGNYLSGIEFVPAYLKHAPDVGFTVADAVAPAFVFVIGLNFVQSFKGRLSNGRAAAYQTLARRYLALIGIGAVISAGSQLVGTPDDWGVLQAIGVAGLICLAVVELPTFARFAIGSAILLGYQLLLDASMLNTVLGSVHGGLFGAISWAALLILSTAVADLWRKGPRALVYCIAALLVVASVSALVVPVSKHRVSLSYVLITLTLSALAFLLVKFFARFREWKPGLLTWWGENALALYLLHLLVLAIFVTPEVSWWYVEAPIWLATLQLIAILFVLTGCAWGLRVLRLRARRDSNPQPSDP